MGTVIINTMFRDSVNFDIEVEYTIVGKGRKATLIDPEEYPELEYDSFEIVDIFEDDLDWDNVEEFGVWVTDMLELLELSKEGFDSYSPFCGYDIENYISEACWDDVYNKREF